MGATHTANMASPHPALPRRSRVRFHASAKSHDGVWPSHLIFEAIVLDVFRKEPRIRTPEDAVRFVRDWPKAVGREDTDVLQLLLEVSERLVDLVARMERKRGMGTQQVPLLAAGGGGAYAITPAYGPALRPLAALLSAALGIAQVHAPDNHAASATKEGHS